jgi:flagellar hook-basal body complex protein FliE
MITDRMDINRVLTQMRDMRAQMQARQPVNPLRETQQAAPTETAAPVTPTFSTMFSQAINKVAETQQTAGNLSRAFEQGEPGVSLTQVMVATQKASVSFQAMTQVRNKLVEAYQEVMNMQV